jgi:hypothetical protein
VLRASAIHEILTAHSVCAQCRTVDGHLHAVRDEESGGMEAVAGLDDGPFMPGLGSVAPGGAGDRRWSWCQPPACRRRVSGIFADDLSSAVGTRHLVATTGSRAGRTPQTPVSAARTCPVSVRGHAGPKPRGSARGRPRRRAFNLRDVNMCQLLTQLACASPANHEFARLGLFFSHAAPPLISVVHTPRRRSNRLPCNRPQRAPAL